MENRVFSLFHVPLFLILLIHVSLVSLYFNMIAFSRIVYLKKNLQKFNKNSFQQCFFLNSMSMCGNTATCIHACIHSYTEKSICPFASSLLIVQCL